MTTRNLFAALALASGVSLATPALAAGKNVAQAAEKKPAKAKAAGKKHVWKDAKAMKTHLSEHIKYPATKADILKACNDASDVSADDKAAFTASLPEGTYKSADDVMKALGMN
jgi:hypothetical protein